MPEPREIPDSRRAARLMRDGAVERAPQATPVSPTRRALRDSSASASSRGFAATDESLRLSAAMAEALHASVVSAVAGQPAMFSNASNAWSGEEELPILAGVLASRHPDATTDAPTDPAPTLDATQPLPVAHPPILRPPAPPALTVQAPSAEPLLPASPARHRVPVRHARAAAAFRIGGGARVGASLALAVAGMFVVGSAAAVTAAVAPAPAAIVAEQPAVEALTEIRIEAPIVPLGPTPLTSASALPDLSGSAALYK